MKKAYLGKFARVALKTSQIDYNGRFCMSSGAAASIKAFGIDRGLPFPIADIARAETILLVGRDERRRADMQLQRRKQGRAGGLCEERQAQRQSGNGRNPRRHGLRLL
jgi:assimilatory nitrate reductase catalytic subunit